MSQERSPRAASPTAQPRAKGPSAVHWAATNMTESESREPLLPLWGWIAISLVILVGVVAALDKRDREKRSERLSHDLPLVLADFHSGKINDPKQFQEHCGSANYREDRPTIGDVPAHIGPRHSNEHLVVLFMRRKYGTPAQEATRAYPYALFDEPTFWEISPPHFVSAEVAIKVLGCTEAARP